MCPRSLYNIPSSLPAQANPAARTVGKTTKAKVAGNERRYVPIASRTGASLTPAKALAQLVRQAYTVCLAPPQCPHHNAD